MRLIDADALIGVLHNREFFDGDDRSLVYGVIQSQSTVEERKPGRWVRTGRKNVFGGFEVACSNCHDTVVITHLDDELFCRHCGAKMEG